MLGRILNASKNSFTRLSLQRNFSWTFVGNVTNAGSWFAMIILLTKLGAPEHVGQFALGLLITAPIFMFATLRLRDIQATDTKKEYQFGDYLALRLVATALAFLVVVGIVFASGYQGETALVILATGASKAIEGVSDIFYGLFMRQERMDRIGKSMMIKGPLSLIGLGIVFYLTGSVFWGVVGLATARAVVMLTYDLRNAVSSLNTSSRPGSNIDRKEVPLPRWNSTILAKLFWLALPLGFVTMLIALRTSVPRFVIEQYLGTYQLGAVCRGCFFPKGSPDCGHGAGAFGQPAIGKILHRERRQGVSQSHVETDWYKCRAGL